MILPHTDAELTMWLLEHTGIKHIMLDEYIESVTGMTPLLAYLNHPDYIPHYGNYVEWVEHAVKRWTSLCSVGYVETLLNVIYEIRLCDLYLMNIICSSNDPDGTRLTADGDHYSHSLLNTIKRDLNMPVVNFL